MSSVREEILQELMAAKDEAYKEFNCRLIPGVDIDKVIGIRIPKVRTVAKKLAKENFREYIDQLPRDCMYEERMIHGMAIGYATHDYDEWEEAVSQFIPYIHDWATCDSCASTMKIVRKEPERGMRFLRSLLKADGEFKKRFGLVMIMDHFVNGSAPDRDPKYIKSILNDAAAVDTEKYYVMMAVAWLISVCFVKFPEETEELLQSGRLDDVTQNKAIQKIRESYRVPKEEKERLKELKRK